MALWKLLCPIWAIGLRYPRHRGKWEVMFEVLHIRKREHLAWLCQRLALLSWANYFRPEFILFPPTDSPDCSLVFWDIPKGAKIAGFGADTCRAVGSWAGVPKSCVSGQVWHEVCALFPAVEPAGTATFRCRDPSRRAEFVQHIPVCPGMGRAEQYKARSAFWVLEVPQKKGSVIVTLHSCLLIVSS